jgi:hypothetical protein
MRELHCYQFFFVCEALGHGREEFRAFTHFPSTHSHHTTLPGTVMVMQLPRNCVPEDLKVHFSKAGPVRDAKMIADRNSRRSKGIAYVEFVEPESVAAALAMNGERMGPAPLIIMMTQSEKNRQAALKEKEALAGGPCRVAVVNLPPDLTSAQLRVLFEPFAEAAGNTKIKEAKVTPPPPREAEDLEDPDMELVLPGAAGILEFEVCEAPPQRSLRTLHHHLLIGPREIPPPPPPPHASCPRWGQEIMLTNG